MSNKYKFGLMFVFSTLCVCACIFLPKVVDWLNRSELGGLFVTGLILIVMIGYCGYVESDKIDKQIAKDHDERVAKVARMLEENRIKKEKLNSSKLNGSVY